MKLLSLEFRGDETGTQSYVTGDLIKVYATFNAYVERPRMRHAVSNVCQSKLALDRVGDSANEVPEAIHSGGGTDEGH